MGMKVLRWIDLGAFSITIGAGILAAIAGACGWVETAVIAGLVAAVAPIVNRIAANRHHEAFLRQIGPRSLSATQRQRLIEGLRVGPPFKLWVAHNRHEAEPSQFHGQIFAALSEAGLDPQYFGGMTNSTVGIEISGDPSPEKTRLMQAFAAADIPFTEIYLEGDEGKRWGLAVWIGVNPGVSSGGH